MPEPISFTSASPRFHLPLLFTGQAQKEFFVNEAHALTDALLHLAIEGQASAAPLAPDDGDCWLVLAPATGDWAGQDGMIACRQAGAWLFVTPRDGMRAFNRADGQDWRYADGWQIAAAIASPAGGTTIDSEARTAIDAILLALTQAGILPPV
ncbi:hypothetical protein NT2_05_00120 [Caenibius tardaugens NBRC 16725]|uniref:DUF2793 domain-containing protein n=1 Tax=Caenibius tardaugens NBRC 16725 TaxID=1219035 RepID=U2Y7B2_9SPHN|nr:DUF2793 domain-containing protein [Caenibius tardaugens]AZI36458.1 DUF2793 domain-containing protein [Caenibius tardaugens NBRC 16725]GAD49091.1 hypothetical protein NT2_05_00120 [Caenibius tardaugens NBRC 16725]